METQYFALLGVDVEGERTCISEVGPFPSWTAAHEWSLKMLGRTARSAYGQARCARLEASTYYDTSLDTHGHRPVMGVTIENYDGESTGPWATDLGLKSVSA